MEEMKDESIVIWSGIFFGAVMAFVIVRWFDEPFETFDRQCQVIEYESHNCQKFLNELHPTDPIVLNADKHGWKK